MAIFRRSGVRKNLQLLLCIAVLVLFIVSLFATLLFRQALDAERQEHASQFLELPFGVLTHFQSLERLGLLSREDAQQQAILAIRQLRFGNDTFVWVRDQHQTLLPPPSSEDLLGADLSSRKHPEDKSPYTEYSDNSNALDARSEPAARSTYSGPQPIEGFTYHIEFKPWRWVVGVSLYIGDIDQSYWRATALLLLCFVIATVVLAVATELIRRAIVSRIGGEPDYVAKIAHELAGGNLTVEVCLEKGDTTSLLAGMQFLKDSLTRLIDESRVTINHLRDASLSVTLCTEELTMSINEVVKSASAATGVVAQADSMSDHGRAIVGHFSREMDDVFEKVAVTSATINVLDRLSEEFSTILHTIKEIAEKTNILAFNTAIEAEWGGHVEGRFALVAEEVRSLAEHTSGSTAKVSNVVSRMQRAKDDIVQEMEAINSSLAERAACLSLDSESILYNRERATKVAAVLNSICHTLNAQHVANSEVSMSIERIAQMIERNIDVARIAERKSRHLDGLVENLYARFCMFRC